MFGSDDTNFTPSQFICESVFYTGFVKFFESPLFFGNFGFSVILVKILALLQELSSFHRQSVDHSKVLITAKC
jgi:hypothetical protein